MTPEATLPLRVTDEVAVALREHRPVVAVESAIVAPAGAIPRNLELYGAVEGTLRARGVIPALVAVMDGSLCVGLQTDELHRLAQSKAGKAARRDLAVALARGGPATTTVSSGLLGATLAGIALLMTGAIGGVHHGYEETLDVSADLEDLARTRVAVVCAGAKIVLDLPRTLEYLETRGVPVLGYRTSEMPAYFCSSGLPVDATISTAAEMAAVLDLHWRLGQQGAVIAVAPTDAAERAKIEPHVVAAVAAAREAGVSGKAITPFLLDHIEAATGGLSQRLRKGALINVAEAAAAIAIAAAERRVRPSHEASA